MEATLISIHILTAIVVAGTPRETWHGFIVYDFPFNYLSPIYYKVVGAYGLFVA